jgi:AcrR family transcriptional regulator
MSEQPRRRTRAEQQAETRARLVEAAADVFASHGFEGASIDLITQRAGFTRGAFYSNFSDKGELLAELSASRMREFSQLLPRLLTAHREDQVAETARWLVGQDPPPEVLLLVELARRRTEDPRIAELVDQLTSSTLGFVDDVLVEAGADGADGADGAGAGGDAADAAGASAPTTRQHLAQALFAGVLGIELVRHLGVAIDVRTVELLIGGILDHAADAEDAAPAGARP